MLQYRNVTLLSTSLRLIYDPATGKPRGFGFCEYQDAETAMSAVRNLSGREVSGRPLRIDSATNAPGENFRGKLIHTGHLHVLIVGAISCIYLGICCHRWWWWHSSSSAWTHGGNTATHTFMLSNIYLFFHFFFLLAPPPGPQPPIYGAPVPPEAAPEAITKAVASLPPEQMFELMKQMKWCIQHNPEETKQLLLHNPQLAYALLQAQVVMRIVDLETAQNMLHRVPKGASLHQQQQQLPQLHEPPPPPPQQQQQQQQHRGGLPPPPVQSQLLREPPVPLHGREPLYSAAREQLMERERYTPPQQQQLPPPVRVGVACVCVGGGLHGTFFWKGMGVL